MSTAANAIAARTPSTAAVATSQGTTSGTYTDLTTPGPAVTVTTGTQAIVALFGNVLASATTGSALMGFAVSGASTVAASDTQAIAAGTTNGPQIGATFMQTGLTAGSNTFTAQYRQTGAITATFANRRILVIPL